MVLVGEKWKTQAASPPKAERSCLAKLLVSVDPWPTEEMIRERGSSKNMECLCLNVENPSNRFQTV